MNIESNKGILILCFLLGSILVTQVIILTINNEKISVIEKRVDEQEQFIKELWVANYNNTVVNQNQEKFHADLIDWARNMTQTVKNIKK